jgi:hypothetical protein
MKQTIEEAEVETNMVTKSRTKSRLNKSGRDLSKHVWKFQEGLLCVLLEEIGVDPSQIHWGVAPTLISVDTDIIIGITPDRPKFVLMVTHGTSDDIGLKKFWRIVNELFELRLAFPNCQIANVLYESGVPPVSLQAISQLFDSTLIIGETTNLSILTRVANTVTEDYLLKANRETIIHEVRLWISRASKAENVAITSLKTWLKQLLGKKSPDPPVWLDLLAPCKPSKVQWIPEHTGCRRALGKLSLLSDSDFELVKQMRKRAINKQSLVFELLEIATRSIGGLRLADGDIASTFNDLGDQKVEALREKARTQMAVIPRLEMQVSFLGDLPLYFSWIRDEWAQMTTPRTLSSLLESCFQNPSSIGPMVECAPTWHWLLDLIIYIIKEARGSRHGYSFSKLAQDLGAIGVIGRNQRLLFSYYVELRRNLTPDVRESLANYLAKLLLKEIEPDEIVTRAADIAKMRAEGIFERIMGAQEFEPLYWLVEYECYKKGIKYELDKSVPSFISDLHPRKPGTTKLALLGGNLDTCKLAVHCRTAHDGVTDKRKELCGRGRSLRARLTKNTARSQLENRLCLLLDGDWTQKDIDLLVKAGWTKIYTYKEVADLVKDVE